MHVVPVINRPALRAERNAGRGQVGYLNDPVTTITQTKGLDSIEPKIKRRERRLEQGPYGLDIRSVGGEG